MISSIAHTFLNDAMAISTKEMPKNHTDKERFAAASSCVETGILTLLFRKRRRSSPSPFISRPRSRSRRVSKSLIRREIIFNHYLKETLERILLQQLDYSLSISVR